MKNGCYVSGANPAIHQVPDNTLLYGNMQDESYFEKYREEIRQWLHVRPEADSHEYTRDNLCIINMRGGEYTGHPELYHPSLYSRTISIGPRSVFPDTYMLQALQTDASYRKTISDSVNLLK